MKIRILLVTVFLRSTYGTPALAVITSRQPVSAVPPNAVPTVNPILFIRCLRPPSYTNFVTNPVTVFVTTTRRFFTSHT